MVVLTVMVDWLVVPRASCLKYLSSFTVTYVTVTLSPDFAGEVEAVFHRATGLVIPSCIIFIFRTSCPLATVRVVSSC